MSKYTLIEVEGGELLHSSFESMELMIEHALANGDCLMLIDGGLYKIIDYMNPFERSDDVVMRHIAHGRCEVFVFSDDYSYRVLIKRVGLGEEVTEEVAVAVLDLVKRDYDKFKKDQEALARKTREKELATYLRLKTKYDPVT